MALDENTARLIQSIQLWIRNLVLTYKSVTSIRRGRRYHHHQSRQTHRAILTLEKWTNPIQTWWKVDLTPSHTPAHHHKTNHTHNSAAPTMPKPQAPLHVGSTRPAAPILTGMPAAIVLAPVPAACPWACPCPRPCVICVCEKGIPSVAEGPV